MRSAVILVLLGGLVLAAPHAADAGGKRALQAVRNAPSRLPGPIKSGLRWGAALGSAYAAHRAGVGPAEVGVSAFAGGAAMDAVLSPTLPARTAREHAEVDRDLARGRLTPEQAAGLHATIDAIGAKLDVPTGERIKVGVASHAVGALVAAGAAAATGGVSSVIGHATGPVLIGVPARLAGNVARNATGGIMLRRPPGNAFTTAVRGASDLRRIEAAARARTLIAKSDSDVIALISRADGVGTRIELHRDRFQEPGVVTVSPAGAIELQLQEGYRYRSIVRAASIAVRTGRPVRVTYRGELVASMTPSSRGIAGQQHRPGRRP